ncbi:MAG: hypothetical protein R3E12_11650 [Candidatus Eisenbacteria bacterium]
MRKLLGLLAALICTGACLGTAWAGPNAGGTLILSLSEGTVYSPDIDYCGVGTPATCADAVSRADGTSATSLAVINCLAAFPGQGGRLAGIAFGIYYNVDGVVVGDYGGCGDFELPDGAWPGNASGTAVTWATAQTDPLVNIYWFAAYGYDGYSLSVGLHPTQGGNFADDSVPSELDPIAGFGHFGFGTAGDAPCPVVAEPTGACCFSDGTCQELTANECATAGGAYQGDGSLCDPNPCPVTGACCVSGGFLLDCVLLTQDECNTAGGIYQGDGTSCDPNPCPQPGACCFPDGSCLVLDEIDCAPQGGVFQGEGVPCDPDPCVTPTGACCLPGEVVCEVITQGECDTRGGQYQGDGTSCIPDPCPHTGACCFPDGSCSVLDPVACDGAGGVYQGDDVPCTPDLCPDTITGACCFADGTCQELNDRDCATAGGVYQGDNVPCSPDSVRTRSRSACCFSDGTCQELNDRDCATAGGVYQGDNVPCSPDLCPDTITGACCFADGTCQGSTTPTARPPVVSIRATARSSAESV